MIINNQYRMLSKLGEGSSGEVYLVEDIYLEKHRAMKVFLQSPHQILDVENAQKEFSVLSKLVHPNLIRVFSFDKNTATDDGSFANRYFYTMEYVQGEDALTYFAKQALSPEKVTLLERLCILVLGALDFIHREGIIHFDIKPQNIIITETNDDKKFSLKLTDFGFSSTAIESVQIPIRGTLEYTAPEIIRGLPIDRRADLYSLGVTLFQLWEGRCPFEAQSPIELLKKVVNEDIPSLHHVDSIRSRLPQIIGSLCRKNPDERFQNAREALFEFSSSQHEEFVKDVLYSKTRAKYVNQTEEQQTIEDVFASLETHCAISLKEFVVIGAEGTGKSSFLQQIANKAHSRKFFVIEWTLQQSESFEIGMLHIVRQIENILHYYGKFQSVPLEKHVISEDTNLEPELYKNTFRLTRYLQALSSCGVFVLIIDEVHTAPQNWNTEFHSLLYKANIKRGVIIEAMRDDVVDEQLLQEFHIQPIVLKELLSSDVLELMQYSLGSNTTVQRLAERIFHAYGGFPSIVAEGMRFIFRAIPLSWLKDTSKLEELIHDIDTFLSERFEDFFAARFHKLRREKQLLLEMLSCFENPPSLEMVSHIVPIQSVRVNLYLTSLVNAGYVLTDDEHHRYRIRHLKLKDYVYHSIERTHEELHVFIASHLESEANSFGWSDLQELARHYELGHMFDRAAKYFELAGDLAVKSNYAKEALLPYAKAIEIQSGERLERHSLQDKYVKSLLASGRFQDVIHHTEKVLANLPHEEEYYRGRFHKIIGMAYSRLGENVNALNAFEQALIHTRDQIDQFEIQQEIIALKIAEGYFDEAIVRSLKQREKASMLGDLQLAASVETDLGIAHFMRGSLRESLQSFDAAYKIYSEQGNMAKTIDALINLGNVLSSQRDYKNALDKWSKALLLTENSGTPNQKAQLFNNMGIANFRLREYREARDHYVQAKNIFESLDSKSGIAYTHSNLGEVAFAEGEYELSLRFWSEALASYREMQDTARIIQTLLDISLLWMRLTGVAQAQEMENEAQHLIQQYGIKVYAGFSHYIQSLLQDASADYVHAVDTLELAEKELYEEGAYYSGNFSEEEKNVVVRLKKTEFSLAMGLNVDAYKLLMQTQGAMDDAISPFLQAEHRYLLGMVSQKAPEITHQNPISCFREGLTFIDHEYVSEISWRLCYALGKEYIKRGNLHKAKECFVMTKAVIDYFASKFESEALRMQYLHSQTRDGILAEIEMFLSEEKTHGKIG